jgi:hypothetical protein
MCKCESVDVWKPACRLECKYVNIPYRLLRSEEINFKNSLRVEFF